LALNLLSGNLPTPSHFTFLSAQYTASVFIRAITEQARERERDLTHNFAIVQGWKPPDKFLVAKEEYLESQYFFPARNLASLELRNWIITELNQNLIVRHFSG